MIYNPKTGQVGHIQPVKTKYSEGYVNIWTEYQRDLEIFRGTILSIKRNFRLYEV